MGYDPSIGEATSSKHVVTGVSNHPRGVMPVSGSFFNDDSVFLDMTVAVQTERLSARLERDEDSKREPISAEIQVVQNSYDA